MSFVERESQRGRERQREGEREREGGREREEPRITGYHIRPSFRLMILLSKETHEHGKNDLLMWSMRPANTAKETY